MISTPYGVIRAQQFDTGNQKLKISFLNTTPLFKNRFIKRFLVLKRQFSNNFNSLIYFLTHFARKIMINIDIFSVKMRYFYIYVT